MKNQDNQKDDLFLIFMVFVLILMTVFDKTPSQAIETYELEQQARVIRLQMN